VNRVMKRRARRLSLVGLGVPSTRHAVFLLGAAGPGHKLDSGMAAACGEDLSEAKQTTENACFVYGVPLCEGCLGTHAARADSAAA
jgi:hypothetical protein